MNRRFALLLLPFASLSLAACGDDEPDKYKDRDAFCADWALRACNTGIVDECANDKADCQAGQVEYCKSLVGPTKYNKAGAKKCAEAIGDALADHELTPEELAMYEELKGDCAEVVSGAGENGDNCNDDSDCATKDGLRCIIKPGETAGECHEPNDVEGGADCDGAADVCPDTHFCDVEGEDPICRSLRELDDSCSLRLPCDDETMCMNEDTGMLVAGDEEGVCVERFGISDACTLNTECASNICSPNSRCVREISIDGASSFDVCADFHN